MRPIGGLFGYIGDRIGRKAALTLSVLAMAVPTFLIGLLHYAQIGVAASALMVGLRMVQGLSVGGEYTTSAVFLVEGAAPGQRGLMGSWSVFGAVAASSWAQQWEPSLRYCQQKPHRRGVGGCHSWQGWRSDGWASIFAAILLEAAARPGPKRLHRAGA